MAGKAMIFAAGLGTRLRPLTDTRPKALVEVGGVTMLERVLRRVIDAEYDEIVVNVCHFGEQIIDFLIQKNNFGVTIHVSDERECLLDTGGGILKARHWLDDGSHVLVHNADILTDIDLRAMADFHAKTNADATLLVAKRNTSRYLLFDRNSHLCGWTNKSTGEVKPAGLVYDPMVLKALAFGGVHIIGSRVFNMLQSYCSEPKFSITPFYVDMCKRLNILGFQPDYDYQWHDVGKIESLKEAEKAFGYIPKP